LIVAKRMMISAAIAACCVFAAASFAQSSSQPVAEAVLKEARSRLGAGYLKPEAWPDSLALLPKPPGDGSRALKRDQKLQARAIAAQSTARFAQARTDADIFLPTASRTMACAAGFDITAGTTPAIDKLMRRTMADFGSVTAKAKNFYKRQRPFMVNNQPQCTPDWDKVLRGDGSYPSGHAAIGYGWGLMLAAIVPARKSQLIRRGHAFAESRRYCNVHWQSDVEAGETAAKAVYAKLLADPAFRTDLAAARVEAKAAKAPAENCAAEKAALAIR
jgi:acid phosphatase (class A)